MKDTFALAVRRKDGTISNVGCYKYNTIEDAEKDVERARISRARYSILTDPIVAIVDRFDNVVKMLEDKDLNK